MPENTASNGFRAAFFLCCAFFFLYAQEHAGEYTVPDEIPLYGVDTNVSKEDERFYAIGWSPDGLFAYTSVRCEESAYYCGVSLIIQNITSDKIAASISAEEPFETANPIRDFWREEKKDIKNALKRAGIIQSKMVLKQPPIFFGGDTIRFEIVDSCSNRDSVCGIYSMAVSTKIIAVSSKRGRKTVMKSENKYLCNNATISYYIQNPYAPQVALFLQYGTIGLECDDRAAYTAIIGCNLEKGFAK